MKKIEEITQEAADLMKKYGVETILIIAKCPDSKLMGMTIEGDKPWIVGMLYTYVLDVVKALIRAGNKRLKPPEGDNWKEGKKDD